MARPQIMRLYCVSRIERDHLANACQLLDKYAFIRAPDATMAATAVTTLMIPLQSVRVERDAEVREAIGR
jgi:hypothetical protein